MFDSMLHKLITQSFILQQKANWSCSVPKSVSTITKNYLLLLPICPFHLFHKHTEKLS